jgi:hypothetical protein
MTRATHARPSNQAPTIDELARRKEETWVAAWTAMCKWIDAPPERRKGKVQTEVDAACDAAMAAAAAWREARGKESA